MGPLAAFAVAFLIGAGALFGPGFVVLRALRLGRFASLACAPCASLILFVAIGVVLYPLRPVPAWAFGSAVGATALLIGGVAWAFQNRRRQASPHSAGTARSGSGRGACPVLLRLSPPSHPWLMAALYVAVGLLMCAFVYWSTLPTPDAFARADDTSAHLSFTRAFLDAGAYSTLHVSSFGDWEEPGTYYPAAWHCVCAFVAGFTGGQVTIATNALTSVVCILVIPLGTCLFMLLVFSKRPAFVAAGSLFAVGFCAFPWGFLVFGQLYANLLGFALVPATGAVAFAALNAQAREGPRLVVCAAVALVACVLAQPNAAFTAGIWIAAAAVSRVFYRPLCLDGTADEENGTLVTPRRLLYAAAVLAGAWGLWLACFAAPPLRDVVTNTQWSAPYDLPGALFAGVTFLTSKRGGVQPVLALAVLAGILWTCRHRRWLWLSASFLFALVIYVIDAGTDSPARALLSGFWYVDYHRTAAMAALFAAPLGAVGLGWGAVRIAGLLSGTRPHEKRRSFATLAILGAVVLATQFTTYTWEPTEDNAVPLSFTKTRSEARAYHNWDRWFTSEERGFVRRVMAEVPAEERILNMACDGSSWAYGLEGINLVFRRASNNGSNYLDPEVNRLLREHLCDISKRPDVAEAVKTAGARYLLQLDAPGSPSPTKGGVRYQPENWAGIESVTEDTPGFTLLLSEGDMRLYRIDVPE